MYERNILAIFNALTLRTTTMWTWRKHDFNIYSRVNQKLDDILTNIKESGNKDMYAILYPYKRMQNDTYTHVTVSRKISWRSHIERTSDC